MPSVLTELGFLTNPKEEQFLGSSKGQDYMASSLFRAFREYKDEIEGTVKKYDDSFEKQQSYKFSKEDSLELTAAKNSEPAGNQDSSIVVRKNDPEDKKGNKKEENESNSVVVYKVQITSSDKQIPLNSDKFNGVEKPAEYIDKGIYKYTAGEFKSQIDASRLQTILRKSGFKDAFVIAMQDGKRIPLK